MENNVGKYDVIHFGRKNDETCLFQQGSLDMELFAGGAQRTTKQVQQ